jgi:hypothetical protein
VPRARPALLAISPFLSDDAAQIVVACFHEAIRKSLSQIPPPEIPVAGEEALTLRVPEVPKAQFGFIEMETFPDGFDPVQSVTVSSPIDLSAFLTDDVCKQLKLILAIISKRQNVIEMYFESLWDGILHFILCFFFQHIGSPTICLCH